MGKKDWGIELEIKERERNVCECFTKRREQILRGERYCLSLTKYDMKGRWMEEEGKVLFIIQTKIMLDREIEISNYFLDREMGFSNFG